MYRLLFIALLFFVSGCNSYHKLQHTYVGNPQEMLESKFGYPKIILEQGDEKVYVYEIIKDLKSTEINQGRLSLDPIISPMVQKTERYYFYVKDSIITDVKLDEEYDR